MFRSSPGGRYLLSGIKKLSRTKLNAIDFELLQFAKRKWMKCLMDVNRSCSHQQNYCWRGTLTQQVYVWWLTQRDQCHGFAWVPPAELYWPLNLRRAVNRQPGIRANDRWFGDQMLYFWSIGKLKFEKSSSRLFHHDENYPRVKIKLRS